MYDVLIIGAGASGLLAGIFSKNKNNKVLIVERYDKPARKILVSGNGRCNYWNEDLDLKYFHSSNRDFLENVITEENKKDVLNLFKSLGLEPFIKNGYYYPYNMQAVTIKNLLLKELKRKGVLIEYNFDVGKVTKEKEYFRVFSNGKEFLAKKVILAVGSNAYYKEENIFYKLLREMGHNLIPTLPSLVQLKSSDTYLKELKGIRCNVGVGLLVDDELIKYQEGELLFADYGLSGICIFNLSREASIALKRNKKVEVSINFINNLEDNYLESRKEIIHDNLIEFLEGLLNEKVIRAILNDLNLEKKYDDLTDIEKKKLTSRLTDFRVNISGTKDFNDAQVSSGGVDTNEIDPLTMESLIVKDLYIIGELLDVDGDCGGYNLGFGWISGMIAGRSVKDD